VDDSEPALPVRRGRELFVHLSGATVGRLAPPLLQLALLLIVSRGGSLDDVGLLALGSSVAFLCGALGELGFANSLSVPRVAFGSEAPPLGPTVRLRLAGAIAGSALFVVLWGAGIGHHHAELLLLIPLPFALALAHGYAGAMNASGLLHFEGKVSTVESVVALVLALVGTQIVDALPAALFGLAAGRLVGTVGRGLLLRRVPQSSSVDVASIPRSQLWFALSTAGFVTQGQVDMVAIGLAGSLALAAVYGPAVRASGSILLGGEAITYALYGRAHPDEGEAVTWLRRRWRALLLGAAVVAALVFTLLAQPFLEWLLGRQLHGLGALIVLLAFVIVVRFAVLILGVDIVRAGRQREQVPMLGAAAAVLAVGASIAASADSLTGLAAARLASEVVLVGGFAFLVRRAPSMR